MAKSMKDATSSAEDCLIREDSDHSESNQTKLEGLSIRVVVVALVAIGIIAASNPLSVFYKLIPRIDSYYYVPNPAGLFAVWIVLGIVWVLNKVFSRFGRRFSFSDSERVTLYGMVYTGGIIAGTSYFLYWVFSIAIEAREYYLVGDDAFGQWIERLSPWVAITGEEAALKFWMGESWTGTSAVPWGDWIRPIFTWSVFLVVAFFMYLCVLTLVRKHWNEYEHLQYPLADAVLIMTVGGTDERSKNLWNNRTLWTGIAIAFLISSINPLHSHFPFIPQENVFGVTSLNPLFGYITSEPLHSALRMTFPLRLSFHPMFIAIGYLIPTKISFSLWFPYLFFRLVVLVIQNSLGLLPDVGETGEGMYHSNMTVGGFVGLAIMLLWFARGNVKRIIASAFSGRGQDEDEILNPRIAVVGGILSFAFLVAFAHKFMFASVSVAFFWFLLWVVYSLVLSRARAEAGLPMNSPNGWWVLLFGSPTGYDALGPGNTFFIGKWTPFSGNMYPHAPAPVAMDQYRMAEKVGMKKSSMTWALLIAVAFAAVLSMVFGLPVIHKYGANNADIHFSYNMHVYARGLMQNWARREADSNVRGMLFFGYGLIGTVFTAILYSRFLWWPIHPLGFAFMTAFRMHVYWCALMWAWLLKVLTLRWGGPQGYQRIRPAFMGIIIGTIFAQVFWSVIGIIALALG